MAAHPSAMSNSARISKVFKLVAATAIAAAFAVVDVDGKADFIKAPGQIRFWMVR